MKKKAKKTPAKSSKPKKAAVAKKAKPKKAVVKKKPAPPKKKTAPAKKAAPAKKTAPVKKATPVKKPVPKAAPAKPVKKPVAKPVKTSPRVSPPEPKEKPKPEAPAFRFISEKMDVIRQTLITILWRREELTPERLKEEALHEISSQFGDEFPMYFEQALAVLGKYNLIETVPDKRPMHIRLAQRLSS